MTQTVTKPNGAAATQQQPNLAATLDHAMVNLSAGNGFSDAANFEFLQRAATLLAKSSLVPKDFQNNLGNCAIALNMAARIGADPLMVIQNLYIVHGRPGWSAQFLIACFNKSGRFTSIRYEFSGKLGADDWGCTAWATERETGEKLVGPLVTIGIAKKEGWFGKNGSKWQTMPEQMLRYRAASWFVRVYAPEIAMGISTTDEITDMQEPPAPTAGLPVGRTKIADVGKSAPESTEPRTDSDAGVREDPAEHEDRQPGDETEPTVDVDALIADLTAKVEESLAANTAAARQEARAAIDANADALGLHYQRLVEMLEPKAAKRK